MKRTAPRWVLARSLSHPCVQDLAGECPGGEDRVVAALLRVSEAGPGLFLPQTSQIGRIDIYHHVSRPRTRPERPCTAQGFCEHPVQLSYMAEGK